MGQRLGNLTRNTNKSMLPVGDKPALSRIIDSYSMDTEFVITLGYKSEIVAEYLSIAYPDRPIKTVVVPNFEGPMSSLGVSMMAARDHLMQPFIFNAGDSIIEFAHAPSVESNWLAVSDEGDASLYASVDVHSGKVIRVNPKGADKFDFLYPGVAGIHDYEKFWLSLKLAVEENPLDGGINDLSGVAGMLSSSDFGVLRATSWYDTGSVAGLDRAQRSFENELPTLSKEDEAIFKVEKKVIKFFSDPTALQRRIERSKFLRSTAPEFERSGKFFYSYAFVEGHTMSENLTPHRFEAMLSWAWDNLWSQNPSPLSSFQFSQATKSLYIDKTLSRGQEYLAKQKILDAPRRINGILVPSLAEMVQRVDELDNIKSQQGLFHGDFVLDNILFTPGVDRFTCIDWRQDFAGNLETGDILYDLAKLNHSLTMNHRVLNEGLYRIRDGEQGLYIDILRPESHVQCHDSLKKFCLEVGLESRDIDLITSLIWISMSPLHDRKVGEILFNFGCLSLATILGKWDSPQS